MQLGEDSQIRRHDTIARDDSRHGLQTQPNVVFYKCPHFLFLITTYAVISCPIHHHEGPHHIAAKRCTPQNIPAHLFIFFHYFSSSCLSSLCLSVCAHVSQCSVHTSVYIQCINVRISWPRSSLIQNCVFVSVWVPVFLLCVFLGYALVCVCACVSDCIPMGLSLNVLFESLCACVLHAAMWSCVPAFCLQTCIPKTSRGALAQVCVCVHACLSVCTHLLDNTVQGVHAKCPSVLCVSVWFCLSVCLSASLSTCPFDSTSHLFVRWLYRWYSPGIWMHLWSHSTKCSSISIKDLILYYCIGFSSYFKSYWKLYLHHFHQQLLIHLHVYPNTLFWETSLSKTWLTRWFLFFSSHLSQSSAS